MRSFTPVNVFSKGLRGTILAICLLAGFNLAAQDARVIIEAPESVAGEYSAFLAGFGEPFCAFNEDVTSELELAVDSAGTFLACDSVFTDLTGKIAVIDRGTCTFVTKIFNAQQKGAIAAIVITDDRDPIVMGGTDDRITIPSVMISNEDGAAIKEELANGTFSATISKDETGLIGFGDTTDVVVWGDQPGQGDFEGGLNDWTSINVSCGNGNDTIQLWQWTGNQSTTPASCGTGTINSLTACNGAVFMNSNGLDDAGDVCAAPGTGECPAPHVGELLSPNIDVSGSDAAGFSLKFVQSMRQFQSTHQISWSVDGGQTWLDTATVNSEVAVNSASTGIIRVPLVGTSGADSIRVKFIYDANYYYWMIDDVQIVEQEANNLRVNSNFFAVAPNAGQPLAFAEPIPFLADIENIGAATQTNTVLNMTITDQGGTELFSADLDYGDVMGNELVENQPFGDVFTPTMTGTHTATYSITSDQEDADLDNNTQSFQFVVTDSTFSKELGPTRDVFPARTNYDENEPYSWAYGNYYYVPEANGNAITSVSFVVANGEELAGEVAVITLYKWLGDANANEEMDVEERETLGFTLYEIQGTETVNDLITIPFPDPAEDPITLEDETEYVIMIEYFTDQTEVTLSLGASEEFDYGAQVFTSQLLGAARYSALLGVAGDLTTESYSSVGFGRDIAPVVRLNVGTLVTNTNNLASLSNEFSVFPNPTTDYINVFFDLEEVAREATVRVMDISGRTVLVREFDNVQRETVNLNLNNLAQGTYLMEVTTDKATGTKRFVVSK